MTAPQPTHAIPLVDDSKPKSEPTWEGLYAQLLERHQRMHKAEARIAELERERDEKARLYVEQCGHTATVMAERDALRAQLATIESARQSDRELIVLRERAEAAEDAFLRCAMAIGVVYEADGVKTQPGEPDAVVRHIEELGRMNVELRERAEGAEAKLRLYDSGSRCCDSELKLSAAEAAYDEAVTALKSVTGIHEVQLAGLRASLAAAEAKLAEVVDAAEEAGWNGVENSKHLPTFIRDLAKVAHDTDDLDMLAEILGCEFEAGDDYFPALTDAAREMMDALEAAEAERDSWKERHDAVLEAYSKNRPTTPAEQPGRAGEELTAAEARALLQQGLRVKDRDGDEYRARDGYFEVRDMEWRAFEVSKHYEPFTIIKEPTP